MLSVYETLFSQVLSEGMTIDNIVSGFRCTGMYPFNSSAILSKLPSSCVSDPSSSSSGAEPRDVNSQPDHASSTPRFSPEVISQYKERFENGYDIYTDTNYVTWLQEFHPDCVPSLSDMFESVTPLGALDTLTSSAPSSSCSSIHLASHSQYFEL